MARLIWASKALDDLDALLAYIEQNAPAAARRLGQKFIERVDSLQRNPFLGGYVSEDETRTYRQVIVGNHRVLYRLAGDTVYVVAIYHAARLLDIREVE